MAANRTQFEVVTRYVPESVRSRAYRVDHHYIIAFFVRFL
jgi:hypothetical protein